MNELVKVDPKEFGLEENKVASIVAAFQPKISEREGLAEIYKTLITQEITEELSVEAKALRLKLVKVRTGIAAIHTTQKAFYLASGKYVDAWKNKETEPVTQMEEKLSEIEKYYENLENERIENLSAERSELCMPYVSDISLILPDLGTMPVALWDNYIIGLKASFEAKKAEEKRIEEESIAVEKAEIERQKAIQIENDRLKKEAEESRKKQEAEHKERDRLAKIELDKQAEIKRNNDLLNKTAESRQRILFDIGIKLDFESCKTMDESVWNEFYEEKNKTYQSEQNRIALDKLKSEKKEAKRNQDAENERIRLSEALKLKEEVEQKAIEQAEALKQSELNKGDSDKVKDLIGDLEALKIKYSFKSASNKKMYLQVGELLDKVVNHINK